MGRGDTLCSQCENQHINRLISVHSRCAAEFAPNWFSLIQTALARAPERNEANNCVRFVCRRSVGLQCDEARLLTQHVVISIWYQFADGGLQYKQISIDWRLFSPPNSISPCKYLKRCVHTRESRTKRAKIDTTRSRSLGFLRVLAPLRRERDVLDFSIPLFWLGNMPVLFLSLVLLLIARTQK